MAHVHRTTHAKYYVAEPVNITDNLMAHKREIVLPVASPEHDLVITFSDLSMRRSTQQIATPL